MKTLLCLLAVLVPLVAFALYEGQPLPAGVTGRFQLCAGHEPQAGAGPTGSIPTTLRIDTATGKAWILRGVPVRSGSQIATLACWIELDEQNSPAYRSAMEQLGIK